MVAVKRASNPNSGRLESPPHGASLARSAEQQTPKVSVIIVNYNSGDCLRRCVASVLAHRGDVEIVIWDNASNDDSLILQKDVLDRIRLSRSERNLGFARAVNAAIRECSGEYVAILNPDAEARSDFISPLLDFLEQHGKNAIVGGAVINPDGTLERACMRTIPTPWSAFLRLSGISLLSPNSRRLSLYNLPQCKADKPQEVGAVSGSFCMFKRQVGERVGFDEGFFLFGEDIDFCLRAKDVGCPVWFVPSASVVHLKGVSMRRRPLASVFHFYNSMLRFHKKHYGAGHSFVFNIMVFIGVWALALPKIVGRLVVFPAHWIAKSLEG